MFFPYVSGYSAKLVDSALETGKIYDGEGFKYIKESFENGTLHLIGLLSDGGVHSRIDQLQVSLFYESQCHFANIWSNDIVFLLFFLYVFFIFYTSKPMSSFALLFWHIKKTNCRCDTIRMQLLLKGASEKGAKRIRVHILTDGRDVLDGSSVGFVETLENDLSKLREKGVDAQIASGGGRMYVTMDRYEVSHSYFCL